MAIAAPNGAAASFAFLGVVYGGFRATLEFGGWSQNACLCVKPFKNRTNFMQDDSRALVDEAIAGLVEVR